MSGKNTEYALVTGGSSGMGLEYVRQLASRGYDVIIAALCQDETDRVKEEMENSYPGRDFVSIGMDLARTDAAFALRDRVRELRPDARVGVLINNAGVLDVLHFVNMSAGQLDRIMLLHNYTMTMLCHIYLPEMIAAHSGYILNVSSLAAWTPYPFVSTYSATKAYTAALTKSLRAECYGMGVNVCSIYFGAVATPLLDIPQRLRRTALRIHVMTTPQKAVRKALKMMFAGKSGWMPGTMNRIYRYIVGPFIPARLIARVSSRVTEKYNLK